jgi:hypothetical protein
LAVIGIADSETIGICTSVIHDNEKRNKKETLRERLHEQDLVGQSGSVRLLLLLTERES